MSRVIVDARLPGCEISMNTTGMLSENKYSPATKAAVAAFSFAVLLHASWIGAWLVEQYFEPRLDILGTGGGRFLYWFVMKLLLWVLPSIVLIRASGMTLRGVMGFKRTRSILIWGLGTGLILGAVALLSKRIGGQSVFTSTLGWPLFSGVIVAPIVEEFTFRGAILGALGQRFRFRTANTITALLFLGIHLPGWHFQGRLMDNLLNPVGGALSIFILGWVFGYVAHKSNSVAACTVTHMLNNLFNA